MNDVLSIADLIGAAARYRWPIAGLLLAGPIVAALAGRAWQRRRREWLRWCYAIISYVIVLPGVFMTLLVGFMIFFNRQNPLTDVDLVLMLGPIAAMVACLVIMARHIKLARIPGFDNLAGLALLGVLSFLCLLLLLKTRIIVGFFGSLQALLILFVLLYAAFHFALRLIRR